MRDSKAIWQTSECPAWCITRHHDIDAPGSRECCSTAGHVPLSTEAALITSVRNADTITGELDTVDVALEQEYREIEPRITIYASDGKGFGLTLEEAKTLAGHITDLLATARAEVSA